MSTPAGWFDDGCGDGRLRWWDGAAWTDHYADPQPNLLTKAKKAAGIGATATSTEPASEAVLYEVTSHIDGAKNAKVKLYADRLEWERGRGVSTTKVTAGVLTMGLSFLATGVRGGKDAFDMLPLRQITSVGNRKDGMFYHLVEVQTAGGTVGFRVSREDAVTFRQAILTQMQRAVTAEPAATAPEAVPAPAPAPAEPAPSAPDHMAQLAQLAQLRDAGVLTDEEFATKKQEILSRI